MLQPPHRKEILNLRARILLDRNPCRVLRGGKAKA